MREEIVKNGCSGSCCEHFTFPFTLDEMANMYQAFLKDGYAGKWFDRHGNQRNVPNEMEEMPHIMDMLIYLGTLPYDDNGKLYNDGWGGEPVTREELKKRIGTDYRYDIEEGILKVPHYTCKHFDKVNKICTDYENRPGFCRRYGPGCDRKCCTFEKKVLETIKSIDNSTNETSRTSIQEKVNEICPPIGEV